MIIKKYSDIKIDFYGLKYLELVEPDPTTGVMPVIPPFCEVHSFNYVKELMPDIFHIVHMPSYSPEHPDIYEINLHYYRLHSQSKLVMEKYFEYIVDFNEDSKSIQETYPEIMV